MSKKTYYNPAFEGWTPVHYPYKKFGPNESSVSDQYCDWLEENIGPREGFDLPPGGLWAFPYLGLFLFKNKKDAMLFKLTWGGSL
jgi:hypothetical protein